MNGGKGSLYGTGVLKWGHGYLEALKSVVKFQIKRIISNIHKIIAKGCRICSRHPFCIDLYRIK
mgnify:CR=1 FL=1